MLFPDRWTDFFLVSYAPEQSFFQDSVSGVSTRINSALLSLVQKDAERFKQQFNTSLKSDFREKIFEDIPIRGECRETVKGLVFICRRFPLSPQSLSELGISEKLIAALLDYKTQPNRLVLITGSTGSGKSTLGSAFTKDWLKTFGGTGWTIENPVEIPLQDENYGDNGACFQVEVNHDDDFGKAIRETMRSLPRLIFVGELRNGENANYSPGARAAVQAATTGHKVVTTMHANDIASGLQRLSALCGPGHDEMVADAIGAILHARLYDDIISGKRRFDITPLIIPGRDKNGEDAGIAIRQHIRDGNYHMLSSEIQRQKSIYSFKPG